MKNNGSTKLRFAALTRVSTERQADEGESLRTQKSNIENIVKGLGGRVVAWYGARAEHATEGFEKAEVERLLADAKKKGCPFNAVIVNDPDRWSRDNEHSKEGLKILREHGIRFFAGSMEFDLFSPPARFFLGMSAEVGGFVALTTKKKSVENRIARAKRGIPVVGKLPFGRTWKWDDETKQNGKFEIIPAKKKLIEELAHLYLAGEPIVKLAKSKTVVEALGRTMGDSHLHKVLTKMCGTVWLQTFEVPDLAIKEVVETKVPRLLDQNVIDRILKKTRSQYTGGHDPEKHPDLFIRYGHGPKKHPYLFSQMMQCGHCGYSMFGQCNHDKSLYYRHSHVARRKDQCPGPFPKAGIPAPQIERIVMAHLFEAFGNPAAVQRAIEDARPKDERAREAFARLEEVEAQLAKIEPARQRVLDREDEGLMSSDGARARLLKLKEREQSLNAEKAALQEEVGDVPKREETLRVAKAVSSKFQKFGNVRLMIKKIDANSAFEKMTWEEKLALCRMVFSGTLPDGQRMGVFITWSPDGKKWTYRIEGHLISDAGPEDFVLPKDEAFTFGAPAMQEKLSVINSSTSRRSRAHRRPPAM